jgi:UDP-N-acetyl-D-galactosamine dehydrogenase
MVIYREILNKQTKLSVIGLGYVGLPIAIAFAKQLNVIGFDVSNEKIQMYKNGFDPTHEVGDEAVVETSVEFTCDEKRLKESLFHVIAVPTPVNPDNTPDLSILKTASTIVGRNLTNGSIVVYESTVYPGVTEDVCAPILESSSGLRLGVDFKVGYSPERINPGDRSHRLDNIVKIVSAQDYETLDTIAKVYELIVSAGVYRAESVKIAEAAKVIENSQRDINIAFMNELSIIFEKMGIDTLSVLKAADTKWNFQSFRPGLVGGHCIGVDPYYLTYKAEQLGYHSQVILSGRRINDSMGRYIAQQMVKLMLKAEISILECKVAVLGFTFKENCPDTRNTKVSDIVDELTSYGINPVICDPIADMRGSKRYKLYPFEEVKDADAIVLAVGHDSYTRLELGDFAKLKVLIDVKGVIDRKFAEARGCLYWRL